MPSPELSGRMLRRDPVQVVAVTGGTPRATRVGKVIRVPEPTRELIAPAPMPATTTTSISTTLTAGTLTALGSKV